MNQNLFDTQLLSSKKKYDAPDHSEIRLLLNMKGGGLCHCMLPPQRVSAAGMHVTIEEIWYVVQGLGCIWRKQGDHEEEVDVSPGICLTIPPQTHFQFRNTGWEPLCIIIATMPPWPGEQEWIKIVDHWLILPRICGREEASGILFQKEDKGHAKGAENLHTGIETRSCPPGSDQWQTDRTSGS